MGQGTGPPFRKANVLDHPNVAGPREWNMHDRKGGCSWCEILAGGAAVWKQDQAEPNQVDSTGALITES